MTADEARRAVRQQLVEPLEKPVVVKYDGVKYKLSPKKLNLRSDIAASVESALEASKEGSLPSRVFRYLTGGEVERAIQPEVRYDEQAVDEFVAKVAAEINRDPVNASVEPSPSSIDPVPSQPGRALREDDLRTELANAIQSPSHRTVKAKADKVKPEVTTKELAEQYPVYLTVDRANFKLKLWKNLKLAKTYTVAIGAQGYDTPTGLYEIQNKAVDPAWSVPDSDW